MAEFAELVATQRIELRHDPEDRITDALGLLLEFRHVDLADHAVAHDFIGSFLGNDPETPLDPRERGLDVEILLCTVLV